MDIQKERKAFEQHLTDTGLVEFTGYGFAVDECDEYLHEPTQVAWDSWLIGLNRAKAQAVPKVITIGNELQSWVAVWSFRAKNDGEDYVVVDANLLAEIIEKLTGANA